MYSHIDQVPEIQYLDTFLNFESFRSASEATWEALKSRRFKNIIIIAEGIPEREMREIIAANEQEYHTRII